MTGTPEPPKEIGDKDADGWTYIGPSVDTGKPLYVAPADEGVMQWKEAKDAADKKGARLPSVGELRQIFNNKAKVPDLKTKGYPAGWYWTSSPKLIPHGYARTRRMSDGAVTSAVLHAKLNARLVRS